MLWNKDMNIEYSKTSSIFTIPKTDTFNVQWMQKGSYKAINLQAQEVGYHRQTLCLCTYARCK